MPHPNAFNLQVDALHSPANAVSAPLKAVDDYYDIAPINEYFINSSHNTCETLARPGSPATRPR